MAEFRQFRRQKGELPFYFQVVKEGSRLQMEFSDEMSLKFQSLLFNLKGIVLSLLQAPFSLTLCWVKGVGLCPCTLLRQKRHSVPQLLSLIWQTPAISSWAQTADTWGPKGARLWQHPSAIEQLRQVAPPDMPRAASLGQRTQLDTAAAQHSADNQWRKEEMWQKWLETILSLTTEDLALKVFFQ